MHGSRFSPGGLPPGAALPPTPNYKLALQPATQLSSRALHSMLFSVPALLCPWAHTFFLDLQTSFQQLLMTGYRGGQFDWGCLHLRNLFFLPSHSLRVAEHRIQVENNLFTLRMLKALFLYLMVSSAAEKWVPFWFPFLLLLCPIWAFMSKLLGSSLYLWCSDISKLVADSFFTCHGKLSSGPFSMEIHALLF